MCVIEYLVCMDWSSGNYNFNLLLGICAHRLLKGDRELLVKSCSSAITVILVSSSVSDHI